MIPEWVDRSEFPFVVHTFETREGRMAYVDEGHGDPIIFVHGNPSWSFLFRHLIRSLSTQHRCIAIDHLGFGLSEKPSRADYSPRAHAARLGEFIESLHLTNLTVVGHDFGAPIATAWATRHASQVRAFVFFNTWLWSLRKNQEALQIFKNFDNVLNRFYYTHLRASPQFFLPVLVADAHQMPTRVLRQYMNPFIEHRSRQGPYEMARHLIRSSDWFDEVWSDKDTIDHLPLLLLWGQNDQLSGSPGLERLVQGFEDARAVRLDDVGNFAPQDASRRVSNEIRGFLRTLQAPARWPGLLD